MAQAHSLYLRTPEEERSIGAEDKRKHRNLTAATVKDLQRGLQAAPPFCGSAGSSQTETVHLKSDKLRSVSGGRAPKDV